AVNDIEYHVICIQLLQLRWITFFFFSSRRRHTRFSRDWSSDVCSSDLDSYNRGNIDLVAATLDSVNTVYVQLNNEVGPERTVEVATRLGLPEDTLGLEPYPVNVLGAASPHPLDMVTAYSTIAAGGVRHASFIVAEAVDSEGTVVYSGQRPGVQEFDPQVIADATYAMTQVVERGTGRTASQIGRPAAGKTGSSQDYRSARSEEHTSELQSRE